MYALVEQLLEPWHHDSPSPPPFPTYLPFPSPPNSPALPDPRFAEHGGDYFPHYPPPPPPSPPPALPKKYDIEEEAAGGSWWTGGR